MNRTHRRTRRPTQQTSHRHAVVIGASMSGLLAARVLSEFFERVTVLDRDALPDALGHRRGVPQSRHAHALLARGREILDELFPGLTAELVASGALRRDVQGGFRWCNEGHDLRQAPGGMDSLFVSRSLLEARIRARVAAIDNVAIVGRCHVHALVGSADGRGVTGVRCVEPADGHDRSQRTVRADLVVDASGRGSRTPAWLEALGHAPPHRDEVRVGIAYASCTYRRRPHHLGGDGGMVVTGTVDNPRSGAMLALEGDRWIVTLAGYLGDGPPTDPDGFVAFARTLPSGGIYDVIRDATPLDDPLRYRFPASVRRRYEDLAAFPDGYLVFGDAICSFNPIYGQGMTVAATEAMVLRTCLRDGTERLARRFLQRAAKTIDIPWDIAVGGDLRFRSVEGSRTAKVRMVNAYLARLHVAAASDPAVGRAFLRVANLLTRPERLLAPDIALRVLRSVLRRRASGHGADGAVQAGAGRPAAEVP